MSDQGDGSCPESPDSAEHGLEEADSIQSSDKSDPRHQHESRFWYFEGKLTLNLAHLDWEDNELPDKDALAAHFGGIHCHKTAPVSVIHMHIFANLSEAGLGGIFGRTFTVPIRATIQGRQTRAYTWATWLQSKGVMDPKCRPIPRCDIISSVSYIDPEWELLVQSGRRSMYDVQGTAWKYPCY